MTAQRTHIYRARSLGKGCSPAKTASARINGTKGGRPPWLRYAAGGSRRGGWTVLDRVTGTTEAAATQQAARALARALNNPQAEAQPAPVARPVWQPPARPATPSGLPRVVPRRA